MGWDGATNGMPLGVFTGMAGGLTSRLLVGRAVRACVPSGWGEWGDPMMAGMACRNQATTPYGPPHPPPPPKTHPHSHAV